eukprot:Skav225622  [mRNA]  locus=scaffold4894:165489:171342:- [translate_table: standard]
MHRAIVPVGIGLGGGGLALHRLLWGAVWRRAGDLAVEALGEQLLQPLVLAGEDLNWDSLYYFGGAYLLWEFRVELLALLRIACSLLLILVASLHLVLDRLGRLGDWLVRHLGLLCNNWLPLTPRSERGENLTCMAVVAGAVWIAGYLQGSNDILGRTTLPDGSDWAWVVVRLVGLAVKAPTVNAAGARSAPPGIAADSINWIYAPPTCAHMWEPDALEIVNLTSEAALILANLNSSTAGVTINNAGVGGDMVPLTLAPMGAMGPGGAVGGPGGGAPGLGLGAAAPPPANADLKALEKAIQELQTMALSPDRSGRSKEKKKKKKKKSKGSRGRSDRKSKRKKKKKKRSSGSSSTSRSSRSRSRSSSSSSTSSSRKKPLRWQEKGKDHRVSFEDLCHVDQMGGNHGEAEAFNVFHLRACRALSQGFAAGGGGALGLCMRRHLSLLAHSGCMDELDSLLKGEVGKADHQVFPIPPMSVDGRILRYGEAADESSQVLLHGGNLVISALNWMHGGQAGAQRKVRRLSAAHRRIHARIACVLQGMVLTDEPTLSHGGLDQFLRQSQLYEGSGAVLALGERGGVPELAADVPLAQHLEDLDATVAAQVRDPALLLLPSARRPRRLKRADWKRVTSWCMLAPQAWSLYSATYGDKLQQQRIAAVTVKRLLALEKVLFQDA